MLALAVCSAASPTEGAPWTRCVCCLVVSLIFINLKNTFHDRALWDKGGPQGWRKDGLSQVSSLSAHCKSLLLALLFFAPFKVIHFLSQMSSLYICVFMRARTCVCEFVRAACVRARACVHMRACVRACFVPVCVSVPADQISLRNFFKDDRCVAWRYAWYLCTVSHARVWALHRHSRMPSAPCYRLRGGALIVQHLCLSCLWGQKHTVKSCAGAYRA